MIAINITRTGLTVDGHAGYAESGNDIICAAVSALTQGLVHSLKALTNDEISCALPMLLYQLTDVHYHEWSQSVN